VTVTLSGQEEVVSEGARVHHSLNGQASAPPSVAMAKSTQVADTTNKTPSRLRRVSISQAENGNIRVLLVEDNEISQKLLKKQLVRAGCSVVTANDGVEAVEFLLRDASNSYPSDSKYTGSHNAGVELILMGE
jgi:PleD family two-component response regulator